METAQSTIIAGEVNTNGRGRRKKKGKKPRRTRGKSASPKTTGSMQPQARPVHMTKCTRQRKKVTRRLTGDRRGTRRGETNKETDTLYATPGDTHGLLGLRIRVCRGRAGIVGCNSGTKGAGKEEVRSSVTHPRQLALT